MKKQASGRASGRAIATILIKLIIIVASLYTSCFSNISWMIYSGLFIQLMLLKHDVYHDATITINLIALAIKTRVPTSRLN